MSKDLKQTVRDVPPKPALNSDHLVGTAAICVVAFMMLVFFRWIFSRPHARSSHGKDAPSNDLFRFRHRPRAASEKQMRYLRDLVAEQNFFRARPVPFQDWIRQKTMTGTASKREAFHLIRVLKEENETLRKEFELQKKQKGAGKFRGHIYVTDIRALRYCERSAYYSVHQYPPQNLIELGYGERAHRTHSDFEHRDSLKPSRTLEFIKGKEPAVASVEWLPQTDDSNLRHQSLPISGRPDGLFHFHDGTRAIFDLKTVGALPPAGRPGDFDQADVYSLLAPTHAKVRDESFVLYKDRSTRELALHKRKRTLTEYDLAQIVTKIERGTRAIHELKTAVSANQCGACGYRSICPDRLTTG